MKILAPFLLVGNLVFISCLSEYYVPSGYKFKFINQDGEIFRKTSPCDTRSPEFVKDNRGVIELEISVLKDSIVLDENDPLDFRVLVHNKSSDNVIVPKLVWDDGTPNFLRYYLQKVDDSKKAIMPRIADIDPNLLTKNSSEILKRNSTKEVSWTHYYPVID